MPRVLQAGALSGDDVTMILNSLEALGTPLVGSADVCPHLGLIPIASAGVDNIALSQPTAGSPPSVPMGEDGEVMLLIDVGGHAHVITTAASGIVGGHHTITFNGTAGSWVELLAYNGVWYVLANSGVTIA